MPRKKDYTTVPEGLELQALKRAEFKCEHCHKSVPRVFLSVGWLNTAAELPDEDDIDKLYCLCETCCRKQKHKLQYRPVSSAADRYGQLQQLIAWHREEDNLDQYSFDIILDVLRDRIKPAYLYKAEKTRLKEYLKTYDILDILKSIDISVAKYARFDGDDCLQDSVPGVVEKLGGILYNQTLSPVDSESSHVRHICRNNFGPDDYNDREAKAILHDYVAHLRSQDMSDEDIIEELKDKPKRFASSCGIFAQWCKSMRDLLPQEEQPEDEFSENLIVSAMSIEPMNDTSRLRLSDAEIAEAMDQEIANGNRVLRTFRYLYRQTGYYTEERWDSIISYLSSALANYIDYQNDDIRESFDVPNPLPIRDGISSYFNWWDFHLKLRGSSTTRPLPGMDEGMRSIMMLHVLPDLAFSFFSYFNIFGGGYDYDTTRKAIFHMARNFEKVFELPLNE